MGLWHDIESYPTVFQDGECPNARYTALDSNTVSVYNTQVVDQSLGVINGIATVASTDGSAKLKVTFDGQNPSGKDLKLNIIVCVKLQVSADTCFIRFILFFRCV